MSVPNDPEENPQPDVDVTVGSTQLIGDAPPSDGTDVDVTVSPQTALEEILGSVDSEAGSEPVLETCGSGHDFHTAPAWGATCSQLQLEVEGLSSPTLTTT
jgi:hypothetical protein